MIVYTQHAVRKINKRKIDYVWIEEAIRYPDFMNVGGNK